MCSGLVQKVLDKSRKPQTRRGRVASLIIDEVFFLLITPWFLILPAWVISRWLPDGYLQQKSTVAGIVGMVMGLSYSLWAVRCQWVDGDGTPALNAPTQRLVISGPYRFSRNPIQLGTSFYILGLGTLTFSLLTGTIAGATALLVGVLYIKLVEEKELRLRFGQAYEDYRRRTPFLIPIRGLLRASDETRALP